MSELDNIHPKKETRVYIKDGLRKMSTDGGTMFSPAEFNRHMFGKMRGGKYSYNQQKHG